MRSRKIALFALLAAALCAGSTGLQAQGNPGPKYQQGIHYTLIENAPVTTGGKVTVVEAFSYMCTHCATFEPYITSWKQRLPAAVDFKRVPVVFGRGSWELYARAYVTAELMGIAEKAHAALMDKLWKENQVMKTMDELAQFYSAHGVEAGNFVATSNSFAVDAKMRRDQQIVQTAGVRGTPSLIVGVKYLVAGSEAVANYDVMLDVVNFLIEVDLAAQGAAVPASASENSAAAEPAAATVAED